MGVYLTLDAAERRCRLCALPSGVTPSFLLASLEETFSARVLSSVSEGRNTGMRSLMALQFVPR